MTQVHVLKAFQNKFEQKIFFKKVGKLIKQNFKPKELKCEKNGMCYDAFIIIRGF